MSGTADRTTLLLSTPEHEQARRVARTLSGPSTLATLDGEGATRLPPEIERVLSDVITMVAQGRHVVIGTMPDELSTSLAAEQLGISRPTLMKLIRSGELPSHKVGSHHRIKTSDLLTFRTQRLARQTAALEALHAVEEELDAAHA